MRDELLAVQPVRNCGLAEWAIDVNLVGRQTPRQTASVQVLHGSLYEDDLWTDVLFSPTATCSPRVRSR
jgi:hypothetical protein